MLVSIKYECNFEFVTSNLEPCSVTKYEMETITYDRFSQMAHNLIQTWFQLHNITSYRAEGSISLWFSYQTMDISVSQRVKILNASSFISSVGGNLGLFIGFSFLDSLFVVFKWISSYCNNRQKWMILFKGNMITLN